MNIESMTAAELEQLAKKKKAEEQKAQKEKQRKYEATKKDFIHYCISKMQELSAELAELKKEAVTRGNELHDMMYLVYEKQPKQLKQFSLDSEDGNYRISIETSERQALDETAMVHINTIKEILKRKFAPRNKTMYAIIDDILVKNKKGDYDERLVAKLRSHEDDINDAEFSQALDNLAKAYYTYDTATYVRGYVKDKENNQWEVIPMQFSSL